MNQHEPKVTVEPPERDVKTRIEMARFVAV